MPFDHARCPSCQAVIDPERLKPGEGGILCPYCSTPLSMEDIFGVAAAFREEEQEHLTLDDLVPGHGGGGAAPKGKPKEAPLSLDHLLPGPTNPRRR